MARLGRTISLLSRAREQAIPQSPRVPRVLREILEFGPNPGALKLLTHTPKSVSPRPALVVVLHGCTQTADGYALGAGWIEAADREGFVLLCPEQTAANNSNRCFNWFNPNDIARGRGEAASIANMIEHVKTLHNIQDGRVFITGLSAGGAMTSVMLAAYPERFAAGAIIAGLAYGVAGNVQEAFAAMAHQRDASDTVLGDRVRDASAHAGQWPRISIWHGDADAIVSPAAGEAIARQWANVHGAAESVLDKAHDRKRRVWRSTGGDVVVEHHLLPGMGHGTPIATSGENAVGSAGPFLLDVGVSSTIEIIEAWGLCDAALTPASLNHERRLADKPAPPQGMDKRPAPAQRPAPQFTAPSQQGVDVGEIINRALRTAGLLK